jgi:predicted AAA+ superfamily ATPase
MWEDRGLGEYGLYFLRDKEKREVDFLITKNNQPWFLVEVKSSSNQSISEHLYYFQEQTQAPHAFQVVFDLPYQDINCFDYNKPVVVPALTFLSQLV